MLRRGIGRVGRPGLLGTMARTAVVAGTATAVSGNVARRQHARAEQAAAAHAYEEQQRMATMQAAAAQETAPTTAPSAGDAIGELERLATLKQQGVLTDEEFAAAKAKLLGL